MNRTPKALVIFSGGQDSTTCLGWALENFSQVDTVGFHYGQRHAVEMECRQNILSEITSIDHSWKERLGKDWTTELGVLQAIGGTSLTSDSAIKIGEQGLPNTFVPGRNLLFLTVAAAYAYRQGIQNIILGVCETDFSGYPDCRDDAIKSMQIALNIGMETNLIIHTPLMWLNKAQTWEFAHQIGKNAFIDLLLEHTHTCYMGTREQRHPWGYGCGECPACELRKNGYAEYKKKVIT